MKEKILIQGKKDEELWKLAKAIGLIVSYFAVYRFSDTAEKDYHKFL